LRTGFTFGGENAESDPLLNAAFYDNGGYTALVTRDDPRRFVIGRTGSGKSAMFERLTTTFPNQVVRLTPENISLTYIANLDVVKSLVALGVHLDIFFVALWKHVIIVEILKHRYGMYTQEAKENVLAALLAKFKRNPTKRKAVEYVNEFGDKFWCEADERVRQIGETLDRRVKVAGSLGSDAIGAKASSDIEASHHTETRSERAARYQTVVNQVQLPRLNEMIRILGEEILDSPQRYTYLVIDDLDKEWADDETEKLVVRCLLQSVLDLQRIGQLKVLVALRTNVFLQLSFSRLNWGQQREKFRALALDVEWTRNDLERMLDNRATAGSRRAKMHPARTIDNLLPPGRHEGENAMAYILDRTLLRPRDAIARMNLLLKHSVGRERISWEVIASTDRAYSQGRLSALHEEWTDPYAGLHVIFGLFRGSPQRLTRPELTKILESVAYLMMDPTFPGTLWVTEACKNMWEAPAGRLTWFETHAELLRVLYNVGFLGCARRPGDSLAFFYDDAMFGSYPDNFPEDSEYGVHPAFAPALEISVRPTRRPTK
jgi:hypothetical protein